jgi:hypothetical protein
MTGPIVLSAFGKATAQHGIPAATGTDNGDDTQPKPTVVVSYV